jgi:integrase
VSARASELKPGTLELHEQTIRYLIGFFGAARRLDAISRPDARAFKTALANGQLAHVNEKQKRKKDKNLTTATIDMHVRNARTIFNHAVADDVLLLNPFDRLAETQPATREWHYVELEEFAKLSDAATRPWQLLLALARWAGLRRGEALNLRWHNIDWTNNRLTVVGTDTWDVKDKEARVVPVCPELHEVLMEAFEAAEAGQAMVVPPETVVVQNTSRDFGVLCRRANVPRYNKPFHTLRKSCLTDWAARFPMHVVRLWAGHSDISTTATYYLQVSEADFTRAATERSDMGLPRNCHETPNSTQNRDKKTNATDAQTTEKKGLKKKAGERIRTADVQLGKTLLGAQVLISAILMRVFWRHKWVAH